MEGILYLVAMVVVTFAFAVVSTITSLRSKAEAREHAMSKEDIDEILGLADIQDPKDSNILNMMKLNMKEVREFYVMTKYQAKRAFTWAIATFISGFALFAASCIMSITSEASLTSILIPAVGGTIVEVLSAGSMLIYKKTLEQLNVYYNYLHQNERFLSAVQITESISEGKRDEVLAQIIYKQMEYGPSKTIPSDSIPVLKTRLP